MSTGPYGADRSKWPRVTQKLIAQHPLKLDTIREVAIQSWDELWQTSVGAGKTSVKLARLEAPATIVGYFFEILFTRAMEQRFPNQWRGNRSTFHILNNSDLRA
ncbi:MAG: ScaI family restriction endonuclease [Planctomycetes bacterium]|nr:ScaI family restriction endonuclease [Planctomycetota bacterium]